MGSHASLHRNPPAGLEPAGGSAEFFEQHGWTRVPRLVQWMVTQRCPLACPHCLADGGEATEDMPLDGAARLIEQVAALGVDELLLTGGEPLARDDLPQIIDLLRANGVRWSLNTAAMPDASVRHALEKWPPCFVAVSLDGPQAVHDGFRGRAGAFQDALDSLAYFADVAPGAVAAGTTVTTVNFAHLGATFGIVLASGASSWGLHLAVPEGRAAHRPDLMLSRTQLKQLLRFCAAKRRHFPVTMADEIGYCGAWEPLLRDEPFFCGAGKAQCVVLPDGEVVPCTTFDRTASAGNMLRQPLGEIWEQGFAELRSWTPQGKCRGCGYAFACEGGCWLQRRHGSQCFRSTWHVPGVLKGAADAACIGLAAANVSLPTQAEARGVAPATLMRPGDFSQMEMLQRCIIQWYASQVGGRRAPTADEVRETVKKSLPDDPGGQYLLAFIAGERPRDIASRAKAIDAALKTRQRSLCLVGLAWRDLAEWCFDGTPPGKRSDAEQKVIRDVLARLSATAEAWRLAVYRGKLDPFLRRTTSYRRFFLSKAGPPRWTVLERGVAHKRGWTAPGLTEAFLREHPHAEAMNLAFEVTGGEGTVCRRMGKDVPFDGTLRAFDLLVVPGAKGGTGPELRVRWGDHYFAVALPAGVELTYADALRLADEQNRDTLEKLAQTVRTSLWTGRRGPEPAALALPALRRLHDRLEAEAKPGQVPAELWRVRWQLADLYLF